MSQLLVVLATVLALPQLVAAQVTYDRTVQFSGFTWRVKASLSAGPGSSVVAICWNCDSSR